MSTPAAFTLTNPHNGHLAFKIFSFADNSHFDHLQRLNYYSAILITEGKGRLNADFSEYDFTAPTLLFFAPYQPFGVAGRSGYQRRHPSTFTPIFSVSINTRKKSLVTASCSITFISRRCYHFHRQKRTIFFLLSGK